MTPQQVAALVGHSSPQPEADIVERLRLGAVLAAERREAADEIERLRCALRAVRASTDPRWQAQIISDALRETKP